MLLLAFRATHGEWVIVPNRIDAYWARRLTPGESVVAGTEARERGTGTGLRVEPLVLGTAVATAAVILLPLGEEEVPIQRRIASAVIVIAIAAIGLLLRRVLVRLKHADAPSREGGGGSLADSFPRFDSGDGSLILSNRRIMLWRDDQLVWELALDALAGVTKDKRYNLFEAGIRLHFADGSAIRLVVNDSPQLRRAAGAPCGD